MKRWIVLGIWLFASLPVAATLSPTAGWDPRAPQIDVGPALDAVRAYPNPWRSDRHSGHGVTFDHLSGRVTVKIFTVSAEHVKTLVSDAGNPAMWDLTNDSGANVASGLYLYLVTNDAGAHATGKVAVIR